MTNDEVNALKDEIIKTLINQRAFDVLRREDIFICTTLTPWEQSVTEKYKATYHPEVHNRICHTCGLNMDELH